MHAHAQTCRGPPVIETIASARLMLRPLGTDQAHRALYRALYGSAEVMRHVAGVVPDARMGESFEVSVQASAGAPGFPSRWCVHLRQGEQGVGLLGADRKAGSGEVEVGALLLPAAQGMGYAREALASLMTAIAAHAGVTGFWSRHQAANRRMVRVLEGLEFVRTQGDSGWCHWKRPAVTASRR